MRISDLDPPYQAFVRDLLARFGFDPDAFHREIAPGDEMFFKGVLPGYPGRPGAAFYRYVESALRTFEVYRQLVRHLGGFQRLQRVLDFGSGHGRLTRALVHHLEPRRIWVSDLYAEAIAWQAAAFGVNAVDSAPDPDDFTMTGQHDLVFVASVFSHLPDGLFQRWLARLYETVAPGGLLAFSVHGSEFAPPGQTISDAGIGYARHSESDTLDPAIYGMSYVTPGYVAAAIATACGEAAAARSRAFPRALFESQDLYVVGKGDVDLSRLAVAATPVGGFVRDPGGDRWRGWGVDPNPGAQIVRAELHVGDRRVAAMTPTPDNTDILKFFPGNPNVGVSWSFDRTAAPPDTPLRVELTSSAGGSAYCYAVDATGADGGRVRS